MPDDFEQAAAAIAVAFIQQHFAITPGQAARIHFDCLDALTAESDQRAKKKADDEPNSYGACLGDCGCSATRRRNPPLQHRHRRQRLGYGERLGTRPAEGTVLERN